MGKESPEDVDHLIKEESVHFINTDFRARKNILIVSLVFMLNFVSFGGLSRLQSSVHKEEGLGVTCTSILYLSVALASLLLPKLAVTYIGHKLCINLSLLAFLIWTVCNGHVTWFTMVPASVILGIATSTLWASTGSYLTCLAKYHANQNGLTQQQTSTRTFSMFFFFFQSGRHKIT